MTNSPQNAVRPPDPHVIRRYSRYYTYIEPVLNDPIIKGYFTLVASLLLIAFFIIFALSPTFSTILGLTRKIDDQKKLIKQLDTKISNLIIAQENYTQIEPLLPVLSAALPEKSSPETVFSGVLKAASSSGISLKGFQFNPVDLKNDSLPKELMDPNSQQPEKKVFLNIPVVAFRVEATGSRDQLRDFAGKIEKLPRIIRLTLLSLSINNISNSKDQPTAEISGYAFYLNQP